MIKTQVFYSIKYYLYTLYEKENSIYVSYWFRANSKNTSAGNNNCCDNVGVEMNTSLGIDDITLDNKELIKIVDFLGRETKKQINHSFSSMLMEE